MADDTVTLRTGFKVAHGRLEKIKAAIKAANAFYCPVSDMLLDAACDTDKAMTSSEAQRLNQHGILTSDLKMTEDIAHVVVSAAGFSSAEAAKASLASKDTRPLGEKCHYLNLDNVTLDS